jgi:hypothetical protein
MKIMFNSHLPVTKTMAFEAVFEPGLRLDLRYKRSIIKNGIAAWMFVDDVLAGETYGIRPRDLGEEIEDVEKRDLDSIYCYSTTILPKFQGRGLAKILKAYWLGMVAPISTVVGHSTSPGMVKINELFGAKHTVKHANWYGTRREAWFYRIQLS